MSLKKWDSEYRASVLAANAHLKNVSAAIDDDDVNRLANACSAVQDDYAEILQPARDDFPTGDQDLYDEFDQATVEAQLLPYDCKDYLRNTSRADKLVATKRKAVAASAGLTKVLTVSQKAR